MDGFNIVRLLSIAVLWVVIALNILSLLYSHRVGKQLKKTYEDWAQLRTEWINRGRCVNCVYKKRATVNEKGFLICPASGMEITDGDYCSYHEPVREELEK